MTAAGLPNSKEPLIIWDIHSGYESWRDCVQAADKIHASDKAHAADSNDGTGVKKTVLRSDDEKRVVEYIAEKTGSDGKLVSSWITEQEVCLPSDFDPREKK
jgi:hypothetical protein